LAEASNTLHVLAQRDSLTPDEEEALKNTIVKELRLPREKMTAVVNLSKIETAFYDYMRNKPNAVCDYEDITKALYPNLQEISGRDISDTQGVANRVKKKMHNFGDLVTVRSVGYKWIPATVSKTKNG
jgi:DNA-binding response OmpR family regulator